MLYSRGDSFLVRCGYLFGGRPKASRPEMTARELFYNAGRAPAAKTPAAKTSEAGGQESARGASHTAAAAARQSTQPSQLPELSHATAPIVIVSEPSPLAPPRRRPPAERRWV